MRWAGLLEIFQAALVKKIEMVEVAQEEISESFVHQHSFGRSLVGQEKDGQEKNLQLPIGRCCYLPSHYLLPVKNSFSFCAAITGYTVFTNTS